MRETRSYGSEGGESGTTGLPYPYHLVAALRLGEPICAFFRELTPDGNILSRLCGMGLDMLAFVRAI